MTTWTVKTQFNTISKAVGGNVPESVGVVAHGETQARVWLRTVLRGRHANKRVVTLWKDDEVVEVHFV